MSVVAILRCDNLNLSRGWLPQPGTAEFDRAPRWAQEAADREERPLVGTVRLQAVYDAPEGGPNSEWATATPAGQLEMTIHNPAALRYFEPGEEYVVEIRKRMPQRARPQPSEAADDAGLPDEA
jgi:hypothetical protein